MGLTADDLRLVRAREVEAARVGIATVPFHHPRPMAQWFKADGTPLSNKLPADPYHIRVYEGKGWSLFPRANQVPVQVGTPVGAAMDTPQAAVVPATRKVKRRRRKTAGLSQRRPKAEE